MSFCSNPSPFRARRAGLFRSPPRLLAAPGAMVAGMTVPSPTYPAPVPTYPMPPNYPPQHCFPGYPPYNPCAPCGPEVMTPAQYEAEMARWQQDCADEQVAIRRAQRAEILKHTPQTPLGFGNPFGAVVPAGATATFLATPLDSFCGQSLRISRAIGPLFDVLDISVGRKRILESAAPVSAEIFAPDATEPPALEFPMMYPSLPMSITVQNTTLADARFQGTLLGIPGDDSEPCV